MIAVEPLAEMRAILAEKVPAAELRDGRAESIPLVDASVDAVTVAQAFHWFQASLALAEIARVLRPGGQLALLWNVRELSDPLQARLQALLAPYRGSAPSEHDRPWLELLEAEPRFGAVSLRSFPWVEAHTSSELAERISSVSFVAALGEDERAALLAEVARLVAGLPEPFAFPYRTDVYSCARLDREPGAAAG